MRSCCGYLLAFQTQTRTRALQSAQNPTDTTPSSPVAMPTAETTTITPRRAATLGLVPATVHENREPLDLTRQTDVLDETPHVRRSASISARLPLIRTLLYVSYTTNPTVKRSGILLLQVLGGVCKDP